MFCQSCGKEIADGSVFCRHCGVRIPSATTVPAAAGPARAYAGFWLRFVAVFLDSLLFSLISVPLSLFFMTTIAAKFLQVGDWEGGDLPLEVVLPILPFIVLLGLLLTVLWYSYFAVLESSEWQASIGKKVMGLKVTDLNGNRLTFGRAAGRAFGKAITDMTFTIGYLIAGFTQKKQALHDILADCLVLRAR